MTDFLPLFPLKLVVYPGERLNLHIFEPRYKQLIRECDQNGTTFGIPAFIDNQVMDFGTEIRLTEVSKRYDNGELDIKTEGIGIFKIHEYYREAPRKLYSGADIERIYDDSKGNGHTYHRILMAIEELFQILKIEKEVPANDGHFVTYDMAHHVGFSLEQEYQFLCLPTELDRQQYMLTHLEQLIPIVKEMERLRKKASMNGHFKNVISPE